MKSNIDTNIFIKILTDEIENNINNPNLSFWKDTYSNWENETFVVFDKLKIPLRFKDSPL